MKAIDFFEIESLKTPKFWLLAILAGLLAIHVTLVYRSGNISLLGIGILFWMATFSLIWEKRDRLDLDSGIIPSLLGLIIVATVLLKSATRPTSNFLGVSPFLSILGWSLLASGFGGFKHYWREIVILFFLGVPKVLIWPVVDISGLTARFATYLLWIGGADVSRDGFRVLLPDGGVSVNMGCSGFEAMFYLLGLAVLFLVMFPIRGVWKKIGVTCIAITIAFVVNGIRIVIMTILANAKNQEALNYWHLGDGSLIFSMISVALFGLFCWFLLQKEDSDPHEDSDAHDVFPSEMQ